MSYRFIHFFIVCCLLFVSLSSNAVTFIDIWQYQVIGVTKIRDTEIQQAVYPYLGPARTINDVDKATQAIQRLYQQAGMPTTLIEVPEQDIVNGVVRIEVIEATVRRVNVVGSRYFLLDDIKESFPSIKKGQPLNISALQEDVQNANRINKDLKVVPALKAGPAPGLIDVELNVDDNYPLHGGVSVSNYNTENTTSTRLSADIGYGNLWQRNHEFSLQYQTTPEDTSEVSVWAASYLFPVGKRGSKVAVYDVLSDSELATVNDITVNGEGEIVGLRWVQTLSKTNRSVTSFSTGFDHKDFEEDLVLIDDSVISTPISYTTFSSQYNYFGRRSKGSDSASVGFVFGSGVLDDESDFNQKRFQADANFVLWKVEWDRSYDLPKQWVFNHRIRAQITDSPLLSNEQITAGGNGSARAYFESQISGDKGYILNFELSRPFFVNRWDWLDVFKGHIFYDFAELSINEPLPSQEQDVSIKNAGIGMKAELYESIKIKVDGAVALEDEGSVENGDIEVRASARYEF